MRQQPHRTSFHVPVSNQLGPGDAAQKKEGSKHALPTVIQVQATKGLDASEKPTQKNCERNQPIYRRDPNDTSTHEVECVYAAALQMSRHKGHDEAADDEENVDAYS